MFVNLYWFNQIYNPVTHKGRKIDEAFTYKYNKEITL